jgi:integrase
VLDLSWTDERGIRQRSRNRYDSPKAAAKAESAAMRRLENGLPPFPSQESAPWTVADVLGFYHVGQVPEARPASQVRMARHRADLERFLGADLGAERITFADLLRYRRERRVASPRTKPIGNTTVAKDLAHLRAALRHAKVCGKIEAHVFERLNRDHRRSLFPPETESKGQVIETEAFEAILSKIGPQYHAALRLARLCGMRKGEVCFLEWSNVKRDRLSLTVSKTGPRDVPLTDEMRALLPPRRIDGGLVFTGPNGDGLYESLGAAWDRARREAGFPTLRVHDLRHTAATELDALGDRLALKTALGMKSEATAARYAEHRKFDRARALFEKAAETRHKSGTATAATSTATPES